MLRQGRPPELVEAAHALPWADLDNAWDDRESGHGRDETRTIRILAVGGAVRLDFPGLAQIARVRRWRRDRASGKTGYETVYYLASRGHHHLRSGYAPENFASLRNRVTGILKSGQGPYRGFHRRTRLRRRH